jgi:hypothetical protein
MNLKRLVPYGRNFARNGFVIESGYESWRLSLWWDWLVGVELDDRCIGQNRVSICFGVYNTA